MPSLLHVKTAVNNAIIWRNLAKKLRLRQVIIIYFGVFRQDCNISRQNLKEFGRHNTKKVELPEEAPPYYYLGTVTLA